MQEIIKCQNLSLNHRLELEFIWFSADKKLEDLNGILNKIFKIKVDKDVSQITIHNLKLINKIN